VRRLLAKYPSIIRSETLTPTPTHGVEHVIDTGGYFHKTIIKFIC
jgi:hypothetical protein